MITAGASAGHFRALLEIPGGPGRMAGLTAALAVCFAPPPAGHEFRAVDLPGDAGQREAADSLLRMAIGAYGGCGHIEEFRRTHTAERQMTTSPIRPAGGLTAENQMQFAAEVLAVNPPYAMQLPTEAALAIPAAEPITPDVPPIDDDDQCDDVLNDADGNSPPVIAGQSVAGVPAVLNAEPVRRGQAFAAIAMLSTMGPNVAEIARQVGLSRQVLYRMPAFCTALQHMRAERQRAADRLSGSVHGRDASRTYDPDDE